MGHQQGRWRRLRKELLAERGAKCEHCGITLEELIATGHRCSNHLQVAHKKSARAYPELRFDKDNLEILCQKCHEKSDPIEERFLRAGRILRRSTIPSAASVAPSSTEQL